MRCLDLSTSVLGTFVLPFSHSFWVYSKTDFINPKRLFQAHCTLYMAIVLSKQVYVNLEAGPRGGPESRMARIHVPSSNFPTPVPCFPPSAFSYCGRLHLKLFNKRKGVPTHLGLVSVVFRHGSLVLTRLTQAFNYSRMV